MSPTTSIRPRDRDTILSALRAGVVPRIGLQHIQVGRQREIDALVKDIDRIGQGGAAMRFIIGEYGAGKTFFLFLVRQIALQRKLVVAQADLGPDRRIFATGGRARGLYSELTKSLATRTSPDGSALKSILETFAQKATEIAQAQKAQLEATIYAALGDLRDMVSGHDFATVVAAYARAYEADDGEKQAAALRWLRGEYSTKTEARQDLGVRTIIDDGNVYDGLRLLARFSRVAGFGGLLVCLDEMVNLYKLQNSTARHQNYEQILRMLNDILQGTTEGLGVVFGGTPEFLYDTRRGLYSYEALQSRLAANSFATAGLIDVSGPVIRLANLTQEELFHLLERLRLVQAGGDPTRVALPDEALAAFMEHCSKRVGEAYFRTPRNTVKAFLDLLAILEQNPQADWRACLGAVEVAPDLVPHIDAMSELDTNNPDNELVALDLSQPPR